MTTTDYLEAIERELQTGNATEHSYRPMLQQFLVVWSQGFSPLTDYSITNEPQRIAGNAPDFLVQRGEVSLGWIETKPPGLIWMSWKHQSNFNGTVRLFQT